MLGVDQILPFLLAAIVLTLAPGPDNLMVLSLGISQGRRAGVAFGLGCIAGCLIHTLLAVLGVSALVAASPRGFGLLTLLGAAYLIWLGTQSLRHARDHADGFPSAMPDITRALFVKGVIANAINPKVMIFFLALLPQFVVAEQGHIPWQMALLGLVFTLQGAVIFGALGYFSGHVGQLLAQNSRLKALLHYFAAAVFLALGLRLFLSIIA